MPILAVIFLGAGCYYIFHDIKNKNESISNLQNELTIKTQNQKYMIEAERIIKNSKSDITFVNNSIIATDGDVSFIEDLEALGRSEGLSVSIDSLIYEDDPSLASSTVTTLKIKAKTSGSWSGNYRFLEEIESLPFKVKVNSFNLVSVSEIGGPDSKQPTPQTLGWQGTFEIQVLKYK